MTVMETAEKRTCFTCGRPASGGDSSGYLACDLHDQDAEPLRAAASEAFGYVESEHMIDLRDRTVEAVVAAVVASRRSR